MQISNLTFHSRASAEADWKCQRARYYLYNYEGGIVKDNLTLNLFIGNVIHDGVAGIATQSVLNGAADIDTIATDANKLVYETLKEYYYPDVEFPKESAEWLLAMEQSTLVEAVLRGFYRLSWPTIFAKYPNFFKSETETIFPHDASGKLNKKGPFVYKAKPDLVLAGEDGLLYFEIKSTSSKKPEWVTSWNYAPQVHGTAKAIEFTYGKDVLGTIIQGFYKGYCLAPDTPVLTSNLKWVPVGTLSDGDKLAAFEENSGNNRSGGKALRNWQEASVTRTGRAILPCYEIVLEDGTKFVCSEKHQWLTAQKEQGMGSAVWKTTEDIVPNKTRIVKLIEPWKGLGEFSPYDAGYLAAAFDGEGYLTTAQFDREGIPYSTLQLGFSQKYNPMLDEVRNILVKNNINWSDNNRSDEIKKTVSSTQIYGKIKILSLLGKIRPKRLLPKLDFNKLGMIKDLPCRPQKVIKKTFLGDQEVVTLETSTGTFVANGYASHNSQYGKYSSVLVYGYAGKGNPPFTKVTYSPDYRAGLKRTPVWEMEGGVKMWIEKLPLETLSEQFPQTPLIPTNEGLAQDFFRQRAIRENLVKTQLSGFKDFDPKSREECLDTFFPQSFSQCSPSFGSPCEFLNICHGTPQAKEDPLNHGFAKRDREHNDGYKILAEQLL